MNTITTRFGEIDLATCPPAQREYIALLGDADPLASQLDASDRLASLIAGVPASDLRWRPAIGEWSIGEIVAHLVHTEVVYGYRYRTIAAESGVVIQGYDQDLFVLALPDAQRPISDLLSELRTLKALNVAFLKRLSPEQRTHYGVHSERGKESLQALIFGIAGHDICHERQIAENLRLLSLRTLGSVWELREAA